MLKWKRVQLGWEGYIPTSPKPVATISKRRIGEPVRWSVGSQKGTTGTVTYAKEAANLAYIRAGI